MISNVMERTVADVLREALDSADDSLLVIAPDAVTVNALIEELDDNTPNVRLLGAPDTLKDVMRNFLTAGRAADHIEAGRLEIRVDTNESNTLLLTADSLVSVVRAGDRVAGLTTDDEEFIQRANDRFQNAWEAAEIYTLRTPSLARIRETLKTQLGASTAEDFDAALSSFETADGIEDPIDEVMLALLIAAKNDALLYDISKWGEDVGIASKATFSRTKTQLEESGLIDTEKVPIDVGRPRLRLKLADGRPKDATAEELVSIARSILDS